MVTDKALVDVKEFRVATSPSVTVAVIVPLVSASSATICAAVAPETTVTPAVDVPLILVSAKAVFMSVILLR